LRCSSFGCAARFVNRQAVTSEAPFYGLRNPNEPRNRNRFTSRSGLTLPEMTVVIGIAALMVALTIPAANMLLNSFESESGTKTIISSALASARAIAAKEQRYAGIRFQKRYEPSNPANASQYIIFIIYDFDRTGLANGFRAVEGIQPIKLPDSIGVMDLFYHPNLFTPDGRVDTDPEIANANVFMDTTTFSIVFSPSGKLVIHYVRARNRDGVYQPDNSNPNPNKHSMDDIFNSLSNITNYQIGMFVQDDYPLYGLDEESSRNSFVIYETKKFRETATNLRWTNYLQNLKRIYINPYTGTIINEK
jgi:type II secretory pathway pseudopilin PulG